MRNSLTWQNQFVIIIVLEILFVFLIWESTSQMYSLNEQTYE